MKYYLQSRWKLENDKLVYYGLRNKENLFHNVIKVNNKEIQIISTLPKELNADEEYTLKRLLGVQVVTEEALRKVPTSLKEATFCKSCCANDFIIPGLEFDKNGLCPMCQTSNDVKNLRSLVPLVKDIPHAKHSRFDVALFYTGGKDSTFLLYYLAKVKNLRVLALTWEIPWISESAKKSIENAKKHFSNVEFITRTISKRDMKTIYKKLYSLNENTCACPSLAYVLFYPEMVANRIPYFVAGNEPVQILGLYYNHMAPRIAYSFSNNKFLQVLIGIGRVLTLHPPLRKGQLHTLTTMKQLAYGDNPIKNLFGYSNELVSNVVKAIYEVPEILPPFKRAIRASSWSGNIPAFIHFDLDEICDGKYDWKKVKETIKKECGWVSPEDEGKGLHTSCSIEKCKEYSQFNRFYYCRSKMIPFSALEISLASLNKNLSRDAAIYEMENMLGFSLKPIPECELMTNVLRDEK